MPQVDEITTEQLPDALENFYSEITKKKIGSGTAEYKNSTLKCIRAGINRYYKSNRSLDIIADPKFIQANEMFKGMSRINKE